MNAALAKILTLLAQGQVNLARSLERLTRLFRSMPDTIGKALRYDADADLNLQIDVQDLEEALGNVIEIALKWSAKTVMITASKANSDFQIIAEDDGPGIPEGDRRDALRSGGRLDASSPGKGLGLAIAADLIQAYAGGLELGHSSTLDGLKPSIIVPLKLGLA